MHIVLPFLVLCWNFIGWLNNFDYPPRVLTGNRAISLSARSILPLIELAVPLFPLSTLLQLQMLSISDDLGDNLSETERAVKAAIARF
ncbi:MAG TPA: hypothetical protein VMB71_00790 [Acetobacteraceae bacterium]|nr:hypothetical protein [Acetobacteraceae bacterium]